MSLGCAFPVSYRRVFAHEAEDFLRRLRRPQSLAALASYRREPALPSKVRILGLDPGSQRTGYAVVEVDGARMAYLVSGAIRATGESLAERLQEIFAGVDQLTHEFRPDEVAIERVFMHRNADSALKLGQARGAALSATFTVRPRVFEYAPREVKLAVVGTGAAQKDQVQLMVRRLMNIAGPLAEDAADALAIALCHAHSRRVYALAAAATGAAR
jgi:crossover junction endodeoxyribonuclease RuvC